MKVRYTTAELAAQASKCRAKAAECGGPCKMKRYWETKARQAESLLNLYSEAVEKGYPSDTRIFQIVSN
ncbi:MAG: hypothetical protein Q7K57_44155 [Burkholderiaceae bacterium]|nr:hypothetical protein [Burkholderiaceae bacterium]